MQIVIPMSGFGERFRKAGYLVPKPLIEVDDKPIIAHVIDMFPEEHDFIFICNEAHLFNSEYHMADILHKFCPSGQIVGISPHKLGPVHAVQQVRHLINPHEPVVVNYCDFTCYWNWPHFKQFVSETKCVGAIPAYKGFHPHSLGCTNYAYMKETNGWVEDIQEKQPYTDNRMEEYASSGTYYFASGQIMKEAFEDEIAQNLNLNGEFYVSLAYKSLLEKNLPVAIYPLQHFMQWGTPADVAEYREWSKAFKDIAKPILAGEKFKEKQCSTIIPMAGLGQRFAKEGYNLTKPLIPVSGQAMVLQAAHDLPPSEHHIFVLRKDMSDFEKISSELKLTYPDAIIKTISSVTEGQACTALIGLNALQDELKEKNTGAITFGACDNGMIYQHEKFTQLMNNPEVDIIVWGVRGHANAMRHPEMFGWIDVENNNKIKQISVKKPLRSPTTDPIVIGTFTFRKTTDFYQSVEHLIAREGRVNGEYYLDSCINDAIGLGLSCYLLEVDSFLSWGTPNDLKTFEYWQSCFHKWNGHPYRLETDERVPETALPELEKKYKTITPKIIPPPVL